MSVRKRQWTTRAGEERTAWVVDYNDKDGRHIETFERKRDAEARHAEVKVNVRKGTHKAPSKSITLEKACENYLERARTREIERSALQSYESQCRHICDMPLARAKLSDLTAPDIENFADQLLQKHSRPMARKILARLKAVLNDAWKRGDVAQNVASATSIKPSKRGDAKPRIGENCPDGDDIRKLIHVAEGRTRALIIVAAFCGLRASELRALRWSDIDLDNKVIAVRRRVDRWNAEGEPKSGAGKRDVPFGPFVANTLKQWKLECPPGDLGLVFPNKSGRYESHSNIVNRHWGPLQKRVGLTDSEGKPKYNFHSLRHYCASWLIGRGLNIKRVSVLLGHSNITLTLNTYTHWIEKAESDDELAAAEDAVLNAT